MGVLITKTGPMESKKKALLGVVLIAAVLLVLPFAVGTLGHSAKVTV